MNHFEAAKIFFENRGIEISIIMVDGKFDPILSAQSWEDVLDADASNSALFLVEFTGGCRRLWYTSGSGRTQAILSQNRFIITYQTNNDRKDSEINAIGGKFIPSIDDEGCVCYEFA
jgi:hypothetical protein